MQTNEEWHPDDRGSIQVPDSDICPYCGELKTFCICGEEIDDELGLEDELDDEEYDDEFQSRDSGL
jgi:hypothetical protein